MRLFKIDLSIHSGKHMDMLSHKVRAYNPAHAIDMIVSHYLAVPVEDVINYEVGDGYERGNMFCQVDKVRSISK